MMGAEEVQPNAVGVEVAAKAVAALSTARPAVTSAAKKEPTGRVATSSARPAVMQGASQSQTSARIAGRRRSNEGLRARQARGARLANGWGFLRARSDEGDLQAAQEHAPLQRLREKLPQVVQRVREGEEGMSEIELRPCPFCGREAGFVSSKLNGRQVWYVRCPWTDCEVSVEAFDRDTPQEAAKLWNRRVGKR